jgi:hypothetical protein
VVLVRDVGVAGQTGDGVAGQIDGAEVSALSERMVASSGPAGAARSPIEEAVCQGRDPGWEELLELADRVGPSEQLASLDDGALEQQVRVGAARMAAEMCRWLDLVAELVIRRVWADQGARTPASWLSWAVGMSPTTARDRVRVALRLRELPRVRGELAAGRISYSKVRAITRVAVPETEELLLRWAGAATGADMERIVAGFRTAQRASSPDPGGRETTYDVRLRRRGDGSSEVVVRLPDEEAASLHAGVQRLVDLEDALARQATHEDEAGAVPGDGSDSAESPGSRRLGDRAASSTHADAAAGEDVAAAVQPGDRPRGARMADALLAAVQAAVTAGGRDTSGADRDTLVIHLDAEDLAAAPFAAKDLPVPVETPQGTLPAMSRRVLRRMACEAGLVLVSTDTHGTPMDVGRRERRLSTALRRALLARDRSCRFPGCGAPRHLHAHHIWHWADGGPTDLDNLVLLCAFHHRHVHEHEIDVRLRAGIPPEFRRPDGRRIATTRPLPDHHPQVEQMGDRPVPASSFGGHSLQPSNWDGRYDLDAAVLVLQQQVRAVLPHAPRALAA